MVLAGDVGGTKTLLGLFARGNRRPVAHVTKSYETRAYESLDAILDAFESDLGARLTADAAAIGVAGPVTDGAAHLTNVGWEVSTDRLNRRLGAPARLLNDLEAMGHAVEILRPDELAELQAGTPDPGGHAALIAAGTGMGQALLRRVDGGVRAFASEGGHADFAARTDREMELVRGLRERYGRAEVEHVLSGPGLLNLHAFTHRGGECPLVPDLDAPDAPAEVTRAALGGRCQGCAEALRMFVSAYGAEAGNLALRALALSGIYLGGGIAPKILPALRSGVFMEAFLDKPPMADLLARIPVRVILNTDVVLLGAAACADGLVGR
jgi:glucokinase